MPQEAQVGVVEADAALIARAMAAWRRFGKGRRAAALDFGDCFTYALAEREQLPIPCIGDDFAATDLPVRRPPGH